MKRQNSLLALSVFAALTAANSASADVPDTRQVWRDTDQQVVHNTFGNCVRGNWENSVDVCGPPPVPVAAYVPPPPPPPPRTIIAEEDRTVYFPFNVASLTPEAQERLSTLAQRINAATDVQNAQVVGYADRIGTTSYNEILSKKRAENVRDYLIGHGVITANDTMTRWVGKTQSNAQCQANLNHAQLIQCLAPDRKVTVELKYKTVEQTRTDSGQYQQGEYQPVPVPTQPDPYQTGEAQPQPLPQADVYQTGQVQPQAEQPLPQALPDQAQLSPVIAPAPVVESAAPAPAPMPMPMQTGDVMGGSGQYQAPSVETFPAPQPSVQQQNTDAQPYIGQPPLPSTAESHGITGQQYAAQDQQSYPVQPSDDYRQRYLTTGE